MADGNRTLLPADAIMAALQAAAENTRPEGACPNYDAYDVQVNGAANIPLPPDAILAAIQEAMADAAPEGMPDAPPPSPSPMPFEIRQVELVFNGSAGQSVTFKLKNTTKLRKAMDAYSARFQQPVGQLRFFFDGQRLDAEDTPAAVSSFPFLTGSLAPILFESRLKRRRKIAIHGEPLTLSRTRWWMET